MKISKAEFWKDLAVVMVLVFVGYSFGSLLVADSWFLLCKWTILFIISILWIWVMIRGRELTDEM